MMDPGCQECSQTMRDRIAALESELAALESQLQAAQVKAAEYKGHYDSCIETWTKLRKLLEAAGMDPYGGLEGEVKEIIAKLRECQSRADQDRADAEELRNVILYAIDNPEFDSCVFDSMCRAAARATQEESEDGK